MNEKSGNYNLLEEGMDSCPMDQWEVQPRGHQGGRHAGGTNSTNHRDGNA